MFHGFHFALKMIKKRPLRMCLTLLQVAAGVACVTIVLSFVYALISDNQKADYQFFTIQAGEEVVINNRTHHSMTSLFTEEMVQSFKKESSYLEYLSVDMSAYHFTVQHNGMVYMVRKVLGVGPDYLKIIDLKILEGNFFTQTDIDSGNKVLLLSKEASEELFGKNGGIGKTLLIARDPEQKITDEWKVIGIYSSEGQPAGFEGFPHFIAPYTQLVYQPVMPEGIIHEPRYGSLIAAVKPENAAAMQAELRTLFDQKYKQGVLDNLPRHMENVDLIFQDENQYQSENRKNVGKNYGLFFGAFAFVAVVVSSIGILSTMLVSIVERTREIGLRRSLGASRLNIAGQIVAESVMLSFLGGVLGIILAFIFIEPIINELILKTLFQAFLGVTANVTLYPILISMLGILLVGLLAGIYPGYQASRLMPVDAIREG